MRVSKSVQNYILTLNKRRKDQLQSVECSSVPFYFHKKKTSSFRKGLDDSQYSDKLMVMDSLVLKCQS